MTLVSKNLPRQFAAVVFATVFICLTTAAQYPDQPNPEDAGYWERMVITIGLGATLALMFAAITAWLIKNNMRTSEVREVRLMDELAKQREAFAAAMEKIKASPCPLRHPGNTDIFDRELHRDHHHNNESGI